MPSPRRSQPSGTAAPCSQAMIRPRGIVAAPLLVVVLAGCASASHTTTAHASRRPTPVVHSSLRRLSAHQRRGLGPVVGNVVALHTRDRVTDVTVRVAFVPSCSKLRGYTTRVTRHALTIAPWGTGDFRDCPRMPYKNVYEHFTITGLDGRQIEVPQFRGVSKLRRPHMPVVTVGPGRRRAKRLRPDVPVASALPSIHTGRVRRDLGPIDPETVLWLSIGATVGG